MTRVHAHWSAMMLGTALAVLVSAPADLRAGSPRPLQWTEVPPDDWLSVGGRLYDKWWAELGLPEPRRTHPSYPAEGKKSGAATWRCKECRGWDYRGRDGAYGQGSHYTGIRGIREYDGADAGEVLAVLTDRTHGYQRALGEVPLRLLARFVVAGQVDMARYIDGETGTVKAGDVVQGERLYGRHCARCHGDDGRYQNFSGDPGEPEYLGTLARDNPWETWHKIRNGHPGSQMPMGPAMMGRWRHAEPMPPFRSLPREGQLSILKYARTLPPQ